MFCAFCGKKMDLPFHCKLCGFPLCGEHRLPENHECVHRSVLRDVAVLDVTKSLLKRSERAVCPRCGPEHQSFVGVTSFDENIVHYHCANCGLSWEAKRVVREQRV